VYCLSYGIPWAGIVHDLSKFHPREWFAYVNFFYGGKRPDELLAQFYFDRAWNHHQKRNPHHWQYWLLYRDDGSIECLPMPDRYRREMLADWRGAGMAITGKDDTRNWYFKNHTKMQLHPSTRAWIEIQLGWRFVFNGGEEVSLIELGESLS
jgi:hypothetical protein